MYLKEELLITRSLFNTYNLDISIPIKTINAWWMGKNLISEQLKIYNLFKSILKNFRIFYKVVEGYEYNI